MQTSEGKPEAHAALLSLHYFAARRWNDAWRFSLLAGDGAKEIYANLEAARFYERAAEAARFMPMIGHTARAEVLRSLGDVKERAGLFTEAVEAYRRSSQLTDDTVALADLKLKRAVVRMRLGSFSQALRERFRRSAAARRSQLGRGLPGAGTTPAARRPGEDGPRT